MRRPSPRRHGPETRSREWYEALEWDEVPRFERLVQLMEFKGEPETNVLLIRKFLISALIQLIANDNGKADRKADAMLLLQGPQGSYKTTFFETLFGQENVRVVRDQVSSKDALQQIVGAWLVQFDELAGMTKRPPRLSSRS